MSDIGNKDVFAENLTYYMEKSGKTRSEICDSLGIAYSTFSEWVKGRKYPRIDKIEMLANYFGILKSQLIEKQDNAITFELHVDKNNAEILPDKYLRHIPTFESCAAGFGAYADSTVIGYQYLSIESDWEAEHTIAVKVKGDSMYPKIEDGDIVVVCKDMDYEDGQIVVARIGDDEAVVKRIRIYPDELVLESINPEYMDRVFKREKMNDVHIEGVVRKIIKNV